MTTFYIFQDADGSVLGLSGEGMWLDYVLVRPDEEMWSCLEPEPQPEGTDP